MKRIMCMILALVLCLGVFAGCDQESTNTNPSGSSTPSTDPSESDVMRKDLTALELTHLMGNGTNLGNTMEACDTNVGSKYSYDPSYYEKCWGMPVTTKEMIQGMKDAGFDTLRIPVAWMTNATTLATNGDYTIAPEYMDRVQEIVDYAIEADMFVIINDHWDGGWWGMFGSDTAATRELAMEAYKGMWTQLSQRFANYDYRLIFEGANEEIGARFDENSIYCSDSVTTTMTDNEKYALANEVNQAFVDTVRATGGNNASRFLLIPGFGTNIANTCDSRFQMPTDTVENRLLVSVHYYDPWAYCGDGQSSVKWGTKNDMEYMVNTLGQMQKFTEQGYGVVIGEYGVLFSTQVQENTDVYHELFLSLCDKYNYNSCLWDCSNFFSRTELTVVPEVANYYRKHNVSSHESMTIEEEGIMADRRINSAITAAPESFRSDVPTITEETTLAWIMWSGGDGTSYSVGDTYAPDSMTAGIKDTTAMIEGEGTYTVALDFSGTASGISANVMFSAIGITNGETMHPGWCIDVREVKINGEVVELTGVPYTTCDGNNTTRANLYNAWVNKIPDDARTINGDLSNITQVPLNTELACMAQIVTIEVTFYYGPQA